MSKFYRQCKMVRKLSETQEEHTTSWIPATYAKVGEIVKLRNSRGEWTNGWQIISASDPVDGDIVERNARDYLKQRKASDI